MFFVIFQQLEMKKKKERGNEKRNVGAEIGNGLLPKLCSDQGARQLGAGRRCARHDVWPATRTRRARGACSRGARHAGLGVAWACCWASELCTWCTQPVLTRFDSVLFLSQFLDIVREPGSCTLFITKFFRKRKN